MKKCLSEGEIKNFGKPVELLVDESSILYELTNKLSKHEKQTLFDIISQNSANKAESSKTLEIKDLHVDEENNNAQAKCNCYVNYAVTVE